MEENPFASLKIDSTEFLDELGGRAKCPKCQKSRKYYCYTCYIPVPEIADRVPNVKLPIKIDIIKHPSEVDGKSTAVHAGVIAPDDVTIYTYPCIPEYENKDKVVLVFPGNDAVTLADLARMLTSSGKRTIADLGENAADITDCSASKKKKSCDLIDAKENDIEDSGSSENKALDHTEHTNSSAVEKDLESLSNASVQIESQNSACEENKKEQMLENTSNNASLDLNEVKVPDNISGHMASNWKEIKVRMVPRSQLERVVFVDSTWNQTRTICGDERLKGLQHIEIKTRKTNFWRHQKDIPDTYLSTVEAIYYFLRDYHEHFIESEYNGDYDNLLFFFAFMHKKIRTLYNGGKDLQAVKQRNDVKQRKGT